MCIEKLYRDIVNKIIYKIGNNIYLLIVLLYQLTINDSGVLVLCLNNTNSSKKKKKNEKGSLLNDIRVVPRISGRKYL